MDLRRAAVSTLATLPAATLRPHTHALVGALGDADADVRRAAVLVLGRLDATRWAAGGALVRAVVATLQDSYRRVRWAAVETLAQQRAALVADVQSVLALLGHENAAVREAAAELLGGVVLGAQELKHVSIDAKSVRACALDDSSMFVREAAARMLKNGWEDLL